MARIDYDNADYYICNDGADKHYYNGEMINGVADGYGIEYAWNGGPIIYKGNWKNGVYEGQGTLYDEHGNILHDGWFRDGLRWLADEFWMCEAFGRGLLRKKYIGDIVNGKANGQGAEYRSGSHYDGHSYLSYQGEFKDGKRNGYGTEYNSDGFVLYEGEWKDDRPNGKGIVYYDKGTVLYEGEWQNGKRNGKGIEYWYYGAIRYEGWWKNDKFTGRKK